MRRAQRLHSAAPHRCGSTCAAHTQSRMPHEAKRRAILAAGAVLPMLAWTGHASSQSKKPPPVIGWLSAGPSDIQRRGRNHAAFAAMAELGWKEGSHYILEMRVAETKVDRLPGLAEELRAKQSALILTTSTAATGAAAKACPGLPIVQADGGRSPVDLKLAKSLAHPGGMVTGLTSLQVEVSEKYAELLLAAVPSLRRVGYLIDSTNSSSRLAELRRTQGRRAAESLRIEVYFAEAGKAEEIEAAIAGLARQGAQALAVVPNPWFSFERERILKVAMSQRWPAIGSSAMMGEGLLLSYGIDSAELYRRAAWYVDRILKGTKPGSLPIEQATKFELVVNMRTANALGITIPQSVLVQATRVIE